MKTRIESIAAALLVAAPLLFSSAPVQARGYPEKGDFIKGAKAWAETCGRCHNIRDPKELRDDQWISAAFHMRMRGGLTGQETRDILTFLQGSN